MSPLRSYEIESKARTVTEADDQNKENMNVQSKISNGKLVESTLVEENVGKWKKPELTEDQKLTKCQLEKKKIENQLIKMERLKRHTQDDRELMQDLEHKIYQLDS